MAAKKVKLRVVSGGIEVGGKWHHNGQVFQVTETKAKEVLKTGRVVKT
jgi:hypothetical protein